MDTWREDNASAKIDLRGATLGHARLSGELDTYLRYGLTRDEVRYTAFGVYPKEVYLVTRS